jgi:hypothetical protein
VASAIAPLSESDCALVDLVTAHTDLVIGVVAKIDTHRNWREILSANRTALAKRAPRYAYVDWVGAAAAPDLGEPRVDDLVELLGRRLGDPDVKRRNRLRAWETRLRTVIGRHHADGEGTDRKARVTALWADREDAMRARRLAKVERAVALRSQIQQSRVKLGHFARNRCTSLRAELQEDVSRLSRRRLGRFEAYTRSRACEVVDEVDDGITKQLDGIAADLQLPAPPLTAAPPQTDLPGPPLRGRRLETQLTMILGAGFGLGVALAVTRLFAGLVPALTIAGLVAGGLSGLLLTVWVVGIRGLLRDRAVLDRWVGDVVNLLRSAADERVATRVLVAETALTSELTAREEALGNAVADRVAEIDAELRAHAIETAKAAAVRDRELPPLQQALATVRAELASVPHPAAPGRSDPADADSGGGGRGTAQNAFLNRSCE